MARRSLAIIERAYRGTLEEQYAHILWLTHALRKMHGDIGLLLRGSTVLYARQHQPVQHLTIGGIRVETLPHYESALAALITDDVRIYAYAADCERLGITSEQLLPEVQRVTLPELAHLCSTHDDIWYW
jgi:hypothetical protein